MLLQTVNSIVQNQVHQAMENGDEDPVMADYLGRLDTEVEGQASDRGDGEMDRVMENLLKSYNAQGGLGGHGPVSSLFKTLGVNPGPPEWLKNFLTFTEMSATAQQRMKIANAKAEWVILINFELN